MIAVYRDEVEVGAARPGENLRLRVQGVEEDDVSAGGWLLCVSICVYMCVSVCLGG